MISGIDPSDFLRNFDTVNNCVTFRGDEYRLEPVIEAVEGLYRIAHDEAQGT